MKEVFALIDCNNFYASCERSFNPALINRPIVILSNNDGCIIARSEEAKMLGIPMGVAAHKFEKLFDDHNVAVLSSNFTLYGDISKRVMKILNKFSPQQEIYSIDESFLRLSKVHTGDFLDYGKSIVKEVRRSLGIPISVGIGHSKTLAKTANKIAKKDYQKTEGAKILIESSKIDEHLESIEVIEIWGIGYRTAAFLNANGIYTGLDFKKAAPQWVRENLGVTGTRIQRELFGDSYLEIEDVPNPKKGILSSRSFRSGITKQADLEEAVSTYTARAAEKLREEGSLASVITVYIRTNFHRLDVPQYNNSISVELPHPTNYNPTLIKAALNGLNEIYKDGFKYKKAGIYLSRLTSRNNYQYNFYENNPDKHERLMTALDAINYKIGDDSAYFASQGSVQPWRAKQDNTSPGYTRKWDELVVVK